MMPNRFKIAGWLGALSCIVLFLNAACEKNTGYGRTADLSEEQLKILMPAQIEILPFTKPKSWTDNPVPDGIEVFLRPLDSFGDQTKAIGSFRFELYTFAQASSDPRGRRIGMWEQDMTTRQAQDTHWDRITRTYRFRLGWTDQIPVRPGKYVLDVTYLPPSGARLSDTYIFDARLPREQIKERIENRQNNAFRLF